LEDYAHNEAEIVLEVFDVLALYLLYNTVHDVKVRDLLRGLRLGGLRLKLRMSKFGDYLLVG